MLKAKTCQRCRLLKPVSDFSRNKARPDGLSHYCRSCKAEAAAKRYADRPDVVRQAARDYYRANREQKIQQAREYREANAEAVRKAGREGRARARAADPERFRREFREWCARNPERLREHNRRRRAAIKMGCKAYPFTGAQLAAKIAYWGGRCWVCGEAYEAIDHVKPLVKQGPHMLANLRPICTSCNTRKRATWPYSPAA